MYTMEGSNFNASLLSLLLRPARIAEELIFSSRVSLIKISYYVKPKLDVEVEESNESEKINRLHFVEESNPFRLTAWPDNE